MRDTDLLPFSIEAEEALLGGLLIDHDAIVRVRGIVKPGDFSREAHCQLYGAMLDLHQEGRVADRLTLADLLERRGQFKDIGGHSRLMALTEVVPTSLHAEHYAHLVASYATRRRIIDTAGKIAQQAYNIKSPDPLGFMQRATLELVTNGNGHSAAPYQELVSRFYDQVEHWGNNPTEIGQVRGLSLEMPSIDAFIDGQSRILIFFAARPSIGKSALAFEIGRRVARRNKRVMIFTLEMASEQVIARWASSLSGVSTRKVRHGICPARYIGKDAAQYYVSQQEMGRYLSAIAEINEYQNIHFDDGSLGVEDIRTRALQKANELGGLDLVIIDHTGYIRSDPVRGENSAQTEGRKSKALKRLAKNDLHCQVILCQQLNRNVEQRANRRPMLADLRQTGEHEENADIVLGLYRDNYYMARDGKRIPPEKEFEFEAICLKNRDGPTGTKKLYYDPELSRFGELERREIPL